MHVTDQVKQQVNAKLQQCIDIASDHFGQPFSMPNVIYKKRGTTAGTACDATYTINLNPILLMENVDKFLARTVPHELAHLIDAIVYPHTRSRKMKRSIHGPTWTRIMMLFGADPSRCHTYDVTNSRVEKTKYIWKCTCCQQPTVLELGPKRHRKQLSGITKYFLRDSSCRQFKFVGVKGKKKHQLPLAANAAARNTSNNTVSKLDRCTQLFNDNKHLSRQQIIELFITQVNCTKAGANTYYYKINKATL